MELGFSASATLVEVHPIRLDTPPAGVAILRAPQELACLLDDNIKAAVYLPQDRDAATHFCQSLDSMAEDLAAMASAKDRGQQVRRDYLSFYQRSFPGYTVLRHSNIPVPNPISRDPRWQAARAEQDRLSEALAAVVLKRDIAPSLNMHIATWLTLAKTRGLHTDTSDWLLIGTQCTAPTEFQLQPGGPIYRGPACFPTFFKASTPHRAASTAQPNRPRAQLTWDVYHDNVID